jgi:hypothetical protein
MSLVSFLSDHMQSVSLRIGVLTSSFEFFTSRTSIGRDRRLNSRAPRGGPHKRDDAGESHCLTINNELADKEQ